MSVASFLHANSICRVRI